MQEAFKEATSIDLLNSNVLNNICAIAVDIQSNGIPKYWGRIRVDLFSPDDTNPAVQLEHSSMTIIFTVTPTTTMS